MTTPAATKLTRTTKIQQILDIQVDLGPIPPASHLPKLRVTRKRDGVDMFVNERDFGSEEKDHDGKVTKRFHFTPTHYRIVEDYDPDLEAAYVEPTKVVSLYTADDLATMKIAELKQVPEYHRLSIAARRLLRTKQDYVDAIIAQRNPTPVPDADYQSETQQSQPRESIGD